MSSKLIKIYISFVYWLGSNLIAIGYEVEDHAIRMELRNDSRGW